MRNDRQQQRGSSKTRFPAFPAASFAVGFALAAGTALAAPEPSAAIPAGKTAFLLIDGGAPAGQPRLTGCDQAIKALHASLDTAGVPNTILLSPTAGALRENLLRFGNGNSASAVLFCGYAMEADGKVFALGSDFTEHDDPAMSAVSIRAFSRVAGGEHSLVLLDLHPVVPKGASVGSVAGALDDAARAWRSDPSLSGRRLVETESAPGDAALIERGKQSGTTSPEAMAQALSAPKKVEPAQTPPPTTSPVTPVVTPVVTPAASGAPQPAPDREVPAAPSADAGTANGVEARKIDTVTTAATDARQRADRPADDHGETAKKAGMPGATPRQPKPEARPRVHMSPAIRSIQVALLARGLFSGRVTGVNSADTRRGIKHFQAMLGHPVTGKLTADETKQLTGG